MQKHPLLIFFSLVSALMGYGITTGDAASPLVPVAAIEQQVHELVNEQRSTIGLPPLTYNEEIAVAARQHSRDMANGYAGLSHEGAEERRESLARIISFREFAENVATNSEDPAETAQVAVTGWLRSSGHRANLEGNFDVTGVGIARSGDTFFFTQIFLATTRSSARPASTAGSHRPTRVPYRLRTRSFSEEPNTADPRKRAGRKRVPGGWMQEIDPEH